MNRGHLLAALVLGGWLGTALMADNRPWSAGSAHTLPRGRLENGLFQPLRYGQTDRLEWATHPLLNLVVPNLRVKLAHGAHGGWSLATRVGLHYPTPLLRLVQRPGIGGLISPESDIGELPHILALRGELLATRPLTAAVQLTLKGGASAALKSGPLDERTTIDLPVVYPGTALFLGGAQFHLGADLLVEAFPRWSLLADLDLLLLPPGQGSFFIHHKGLATWHRSERFRLQAGYIFVYGTYPFGAQAHLLPLVDVQWSRQRGR